MKEAKKPNATLIAFEKLRDSAVENLCKALRAGMRTHEKDIVKALIFSVSNRLYTQDKAKDAQLMSQNTILTLGHIAVALRHEEKVTLILIETFCIILENYLQVAENILMFFQQKFCRSISNPDMDRLIVDQLGCMAIARTDNEDKVEDLFAKSSTLEMQRCRP